MTRAEQREAAEVLRRVVGWIDQGKVEAPTYGLASRVLFGRGADQRGEWVAL
jgi:hypothetical protein